VLTSAIGVEVLVDFANIAETELLLIDASTTVRDFTNEIAGTRRTTAWRTAFRDGTGRL
jgi:L-arabinose isomerase